jgi:hypothetical protein
MDKDLRLRNRHRVKHPFKMGIQLGAIEHCSRFSLT